MVTRPRVSAVYLAVGELGIGLRLAAAHQSESGNDQIRHQDLALRPGPKEWKPLCSILYYVYWLIDSVPLLQR